MQKLISFVIMAIAVMTVICANAQETRVDGDNGMWSNVFGSKENFIFFSIDNADNIAKVPLTISFHTDTLICAAEAYIKGIDPALFVRDSVSKFVYKAGSSLDKNHEVITFNNTARYGNEAFYVSITGKGNPNFIGTEGDLVTLYFDASNLSDSTYTISLVDAFLVSNDKVETGSHTTSWFTTDESYTKVTFAKSNGKIEIIKVEPKDTTIVEPKDTTKVTIKTNTLMGEDISAITGSQVELPIVLEDAADISDLQFDLYLPTGVSVATDEDGELLISVSDDRTSAGKHQIYSLAQSDSAVRVMCVSPTGNTFTGDSGKVVVITLNVDAAAGAGDYEIALKNVVVSNADSTYYLQDATSLLSVEAYTLGDINADGEINVGDLSKLINMVLTNYTTVDNTFLAADVNKDGELNVGDYSQLVEMILSAATSAQSKSFAASGNKPNYPMTTAELQAEPLTIAAGQEKTVAVSLKNNGQNFNAIQFDVLLPEGLTLVADQTITTSRTRGFSVAASNSRVVMFNAMNAAISGTEGTILYLTLKADDNLADGSYELEFSNIILADMNSNPVKAPAFISTVVVDDLTGIGGITSANGLNVENTANGLVLTSDRDQTVRIYSAAGALVKTVSLKSSQSKTIALVPGVYVINNVKTTVR